MPKHGAPNLLHSACVPDALRVPSAGRLRPRTGGAVRSTPPGSTPRRPRARPRSATSPPAATKTATNSDRKHGGDAPPTGTIRLFPTRMNGKPAGTRIRCERCETTTLPARLRCLTLRFGPSATPIIRRATRSFSASDAIRAAHQHRRPGGESSRQARSVRAIGQQGHGLRPCSRGPSAKIAAMNDAPDSTGQKIELVERFLAAFDRRWPSEQELAELVAPDIRFSSSGRT